MEGVGDHGGRGRRRREDAPVWTREVEGAPDGPIPQLPAFLGQPGHRDGAGSARDDIGQRATADVDEPGGDVLAAVGSSAHDEHLVAPEAADVADASGGGAGRTGGTAEHGELDRLHAGPVVHPGDRSEARAARRRRLRLDVGARLAVLAPRRRGTSPPVDRTSTRGVHDLRGARAPPPRSHDRALVGVPAVGSRHTGLVFSHTAPSKGRHIVPPQCEDATSARSRRDSLPCSPMTGREGATTRHARGRAQCS